MALKEISSGSLYARSSKCPSVTIGLNVYAIPSNGPANVSLYPGRSSRTKNARYSYSLLAYKYWTENALSVIGTSDHSQLFISYEDEFSPPETRSKNALVKRSGSSIEITTAGPVSNRSQAVLLSIVAGVYADLFTANYVNDPLLFCDAVYFAFAKDNPVYIDDIPDNGIIIQAELAYNSELYDDIIGTSKFTRAPKNNPAPASSSFDFEPFLNGDCILPYEWDEESKKNIPALETLEEFVPSRAFYTVANKISFRLNKVIERLNSGKTGKDAICNDFLNLLFAGNPGTGKTALAAALAAALGLPIYTVPIQKHTEEDTFEGKNKLVDGKLSFANTDFLKAYKHGGIVVLEEINLGNPDMIMGSLGQAIVKPFVLFENGITRVERHPMFIMVATQNVGTVGSKDMSEAFLNRFHGYYRIDDPTESEFIDRLTAVHPNEAECKWAYSTYQKIRKFLCSTDANAADVALVLGFRTCETLLKCLEEGATKREALENVRTVVWIKSQDEEIDNALKAVINSLPGLD